jgi:hypothetical protein
MTQRERSMLIAVCTIGAFLLLFGGFVVAANVWDGLDQKDKLIETLQSDVSSAETKVLVLAKRQARLRQLQAISLPPDRKTARSRYRTFLQDLCERHFPNRENEARKWEIPNEGGNPAAASARTSNLAAPIPFQVTIRGATLSQMVAFLIEFHAADVPHQIRAIDFTPLPDAKLEVVLKVEALTMPTAPDRDAVPAVLDTHRFAAELVASLQPATPLSMRGLGTIAPIAVHGSHKLASARHLERDYHQLATKNVFIGLTPQSAVAAADQNVLKGVQLTAITMNFINTEAWIRNRFTNDMVKLRAEVPFDTFKIFDRNGQTVLSGKVLAIDARQIEILAEMGNETRKCVVHVGSFLDQAWKDGKKPSDVEMKDMGKDSGADSEKQ